MIRSLRPTLITISVFLAYMIITPHIGTSFNFYAHQVQVIKDGYLIIEYPVTPYLLYIINIFTNNIMLSMQLLVSLCMVVSFLLCIQITNGQHRWLSILVPLNVYSFLLAESALIRNIVSVPMILFLANRLDQFNRKQLQQPIIVSFIAISLLFMTHNLSLAVGVLTIVIHILLSDQFSCQEKSLIILFPSIMLGMVLLFSMEALIPWMLSNLWINWPKIFEIVNYVPVSMMVFNFLLVLLFPPERKIAQTCAVVGLLLFLGSCIAPIGIDMRLIYYTPIFLLPCIHSNIVEQRYVGVNLFYYLLTIANFVLLVARALTT